MRRRIALVGLFVVAGCTTARTLESASIRDAKRAEQLAERGEGEAAARARDRAIAEHEEAKRRAANRNSYLESEVFLF